MKRRNFIGKAVGTLAGAGAGSVAGSERERKGTAQNTPALASDGKVEWEAASISAGPFRVEASAVRGNPRLYMAYNMTPIDWSLVNQDDRGMAFGFETDYYDGTPNKKMEMYWQYQFISGFGDEETCTYRRSLMAQWDKETNLPTILYLSSGVSGGIVFGINDGTGNAYQEQVVGKTKAQLNGPTFNVYNQPGGKTKALAVDSVATDAATGLKVTSSAAFGGVHVQAASSELHESLYLDSLGAGSLVLNEKSGGNILAPSGGISADGAWATGGAGYAEYFEWEDGNPGGEDRRGLSVVLVGEKIRTARGWDSASVIGVIAARPAVVGNAAEMMWHGAHVRDAFGGEVYEDAVVVVWNDGRVDHRYFEDQIPEGLFPPADAIRGVEKRRVRNDDYEASQTYIPRSLRREWAAVALTGKVVMRRGQLSRPEWRKLRLIDENHELWLIS